jgi:hypothetical protein
VANVLATLELFNGSFAGTSENPKGAALREFWSARSRCPLLNQVERRASAGARIIAVNNVRQSSEFSSLRGPEAQRIGGWFWFATGALLLTTFAVVIIVSFVSATNDNARIDRLKTRGLPVVITVTNCVGNIGGSGSNASGYTCNGAYGVKGVKFQEIIGAKSTFSLAGSTVQGIADPAHPSTIELASAVARSSSSLSVYVVPSVLAILIVASTLLFLRRLRSSRFRPPK